MSSGDRDRNDLNLWLENEGKTGGRDGESGGWLQKNLVVWLEKKITYYCICSEMLIMDDISCALFCGFWWQHRAERSPALELIEMVIMHNININQGNSISWIESMATRNNAQPVTFSCALFWLMLLPIFCKQNGNRWFGGLYHNFFRRMRKHSIPNFIQKTWEMLQQERNLAIVSWNAEGTTFEIHNECLFTEDLLPHYFKHSNMASFIRQLNMYNFHKRKTSTGNTEFFHKLFRKNHSELLIGIRRKPSQAEMVEAERLIKQLAPECLQHTISTSDGSPDLPKSPVKQEQNSPCHYIPQMQPEYYPELAQVWILTPVLANAFQDYQWKDDKKIKTNIIIQRVGLENMGNYGHFYAN